MRYEKDIIGFHALLNLMLEERGVTTEELRTGLCSRSQMNFITSGERLPDYQMRNRIMGRLGVSAEGYEDYVCFDEYERWLESERLIQLIEAANSQEAESLLAKLKEKWETKNIIEEQFLLDMEARILMQKGASNEDIFERYEQAVECSLSGIDLYSDKRILAAPEEFYYLIRFLEFYGKICGKQEQLRIRNGFENVCKSIVAVCGRDITKAKVLPMALYKFYDFIKHSAINDNKLEIDLWEYSNEALDALRDSKSSFYLLELLELRRIISNKFGIQFETKEFEIRFSQEYAELLKEYNISDMEYSGYIYRSSEVHNISEVIRSRRKAFGISREELAEGVCSVRTLERIEAKHSKGQYAVISGLFKKLNLCFIYRRYGVIAKNRKAFLVYRECRRLINEKNFEYARIKYEELKKLLDDKYILNKQVLLRLDNTLSLNENVITSEEYKNNLTKGVLLSIPEKAINVVDRFYTTDAEFMMLFNTHLWLNNKCSEMIKTCRLYESVQIYNYWGRYNIVMQWHADRILANSGRYDESTELFKYLNLVGLKSKDLHMMSSRIYNIGWNAMKKAGKTDAEARENVFRNQAINLATFCDEKAMLGYFRKTTTNT